MRGRFFVGTLDKPTFLLNLRPIVSQNVSTQIKRTFPGRGGLGVLFTQSFLRRDETWHRTTRGGTREGGEVGGERHWGRGRWRCTLRQQKNPCATVQSEGTGRVQWGRRSLRVGGSSTHLGRRSPKIRVESPITSDLRKDSVRSGVGPNRRGTNTRVSHKDSATNSVTK